MIRSNRRLKNLPAAFMLKAALVITSLAITSLAITSLATMDSLHAQEGPPPKVVPLFTLEDLQGREVSLEDYRGSVVMINFWATYCAPCIEEMPTMQALLESFSDKPFAILAVNMGEEREKVLKFLDRIGAEFDYPLLLDPTMKVASDYKVRALPATLFVDKHGEFAFGGVGAREWNSAEVRNEILPLFDR